jgi:MFS family permease
MPLSISSRTVSGTSCMSARTHAISILLLSIACVFTCGSAYSISAWSPQLKSELNCTQSQIELVGSIGNLGGYVLPFSGTLVYALPEYLVALICLVATVGGFLPMSLAVSATPGSTFAPLRNTTILGLLFALGGFGSSMLYALLLTVNLGNTPAHLRGTTVAVVATVFGLSASLYTLVYTDALKSDVAGLLMTLAASVSVACILAALFVRRLDVDLVWGSPKEKDVVAEEDPRAALLLEDSHVESSDGAQFQHVTSFHRGSGTFAAAPSLMHGIGRGEDINTAYPSLQQQSRSAVLPASIDVFTPPPTIIHRRDSLDVEDASLESDEDGSDAARRASEELQAYYQLHSCGGGLSGRVFGAVLYLARTPMFWALTLLFFLMAGVGLVMINNIGHVVESLNGGVQDRELTSLLILLLSIANGAGRLVMAMSDYTPLKKGVWLLGVCILMTTSFVGSALVTEKSLLVFGVLGVGAAYGGLWSIMPIIVSDNYGATNFAMNFGWIACAPGGGSALFNHFTGVFYERHVEEGSNACVGPQCYRDAFIMCAVAAGVATLLAVMILPKTHGKRRNAPK